MAEFEHFQVKKVGNNYKTGINLSTNEMRTILYNNGTMVVLDR